MGVDNSYLIALCNKESQGKTKKELYIDLNSTFFHPKTGQKKKYENGENYYSKFGFEKIEGTKNSFEVILNVVDLSNQISSKFGDLFEAIQSINKEKEKVIKKEVVVNIENVDLNFKG